MLSCLHVLTHPYVCSSIGDIPEETSLFILGGRIEHHFSGGLWCTRSFLFQKT